MIENKVKSLGPFVYEFTWSATMWYYLTRSNEKINMRFFIGTVDHPLGVKIYQIVIGSLKLSFAKKK